MSKKIGSGRSGDTFLATWCKTKVAAKMMDLKTSKHNTSVIQYNSSTRQLSISPWELRPPLHLTTSYHHQHLQAKDYITFRLPSTSDGGPCSVSNYYLQQILLNEFFQEVAIVSKLNHPNICRFLGAAIQPPTYCVIFEYMEGGDLYHFLRSKKKIKFFQIAQVCALTDI